MAYRDAHASAVQKRARAAIFGSTLCGLECAHIAAVMTLHTLGLNGEEAMIRVAYRASDRDCRAWETAH